MKDHRMSRRARRAGALALATVGLVGTHAAPGWGAGWVPAAPVGGPTVLADDTPFVAGSAGSAVAAWTVPTLDPDVNMLAVAAREPGAAPAAGAAVSGANAADAPSVAGNATGTIAVAYTATTPAPAEDAIVTLRVYQAGRFVSQHVISGTDAGDAASEATVAVAPDGSILLAWLAEETTTTARAVVRRPNGSVGAPFQLSNIGNAAEMDAAADGSGFLTAFTREDGDTTSIEVVRVPLAGGSTTPQTLAAGTVDPNTGFGDTLGTPVVAAGGGRAAVAYSLYRENPDSTQTLEIHGAIGTVAGGVGAAPVKLSGTHGEAERPAIAAGPNGTIAVTYGDGANGGTTNLVVAAPGATWGAPQGIAGTTVRADLGVLPDGSVLVGLANARLEGFLRRPDGTTAPVGPADPTGITGGSVAGDGAGHVVAAFRDAIGGVSLAAYDAAGPRPGTVEVPEEGRAGERLSFASSGAVDAWSDVAGARWAFGDGAGADGARVTHVYEEGARRYDVVLTLRDSLGNESALVQSVGIRGRDGTPPPPPAPKPAPPTPPGHPDTIAPVLGKVVLSRSIFRVAPGATAIAAGRTSVRAGSVARFRTLEPGRVRVVISRMADVPSGRSACRAAGLPVRSKTGGPRRVKIERTLGAGTHRIRLTGRVGRKALARGRYELRVSVADASGNRSKAQVTRFTLC
jgi:hypothetical protein